MCMKYEMMNHYIKSQRFFHDQIMFTKLNSIIYGYNLIWLLRNIICVNIKNPMIRHCHADKFSKKKLIFNICPHPSLNKTL